MSSGTSSEILRAYWELRKRGRPDLRAFEVAVTVYRLRNPGATHEEAVEAVSEWIADETEV